MESQNSHRFSPDERNAMRAYLQRCEVRLSTMHRVAVGFLSGAGLLFLFPILVKDGVLLILRAILEFNPIVNMSGTGATVWMVILYGCLIYPFVLSLAIPAVALFLVFKDIVRFYFVAHPPTFPDALFNPRFILTGVAFSTDESAEVKARILRYQYGTDLINFATSQSEAQAQYYHDIIDKPDRMIVPRSRKLPRLVRMHVLSIPSQKPLDQLADDDLVRVQGTYTNHGEDEELLLNQPYVDRTLKEIDGFNAALGLAGFIDRPLYEEVAKTEVSLVRHSLKLRRLVLRYFQALLIMVWTGIVTFLMLPFIQDSQARVSLLNIFAVGYFVWAVGAPIMVRLPHTWLAEDSRAEVRHKGVNLFQKSDAIQRFSNRTQWLSYIALATSLLALLIEFCLGIGS
jgi:hypothetical protein